MLHEKIVRLGTSFQMVKEIFFSDFQTKYHIYSFSMQCASRYAIFNWQRGVFYEKSSEVTPSPCEHVSSDEDCSSRTGQPTADSSSSSIRIAMVYIA